MFTDALFIIAKIQSQPMCPSIKIDEWIKTITQNITQPEEWHLAIYNNMDAPKVCYAK